MKFKKSILALGSLAAIAAPVAAVVSCGVTADTKAYDLTHKTDGAGKAYDSLVNALPTKAGTALKEAAAKVELVAKKDSVSVLPFGKTVDADKIEFVGDAQVAAGTLSTGMVRKVMGISDNIFVSSYTASKGTGDDKITGAANFGFVSTPTSFKLVQVLPKDVKTLYSVTTPGTQILIDAVKAYTGALEAANKAATDKTVQALKDSMDTLTNMCGADLVATVVSTIEAEVANVKTAQDAYDAADATAKPAKKTALDTANTNLTKTAVDQIKLLTAEAKKVNDAYKDLVAIVK